MDVLDQPQQLRERLQQARHAGKAVGFHPTMGALHGGHKANIARAAAECDVVAVSVFVNPLQFGPGEDLACYPRTLDDDLAKAEEAGADVVLVPSPAAMWATPPETMVTAGALGQRWEGRARPGHFDGVATVVTKLLSIVGPCYAYFGEKDYQQLAVVCRLVADLSLPAVVVPCATVRRPDGLALSSRNAYLSQAESEAAPSIYWSLLAAKRALGEPGATDPAVARQAISQVMGRQSAFSVDYAEVVDPATLEPLSIVEGEARILVAARCQSARLIDNIGVGQPEG